MAITLYEEVVEKLAQHHVRVGKTEYGRIANPGFVVAGGPEGKARVSHMTLAPDLLDPDRTSDDELAAERHRMIDAYAATLVEAGLRVDRRGPRSRHPYLLVGH